MGTNKHAIIASYFNIKQNNNKNESSKLESLLTSQELLQNLSEG